MIMKGQGLPNPVDGPQAMYCSPFVRHCYTTAGKDFIGPEVSVSNMTLEDIAQVGIKVDAIEIYKP